MTARADPGSARQHGDEASIGRVTRTLHWGSALLLVAVFALAWTVSALGPTAVSARLVQAALYLCLLAMPLVGWLGSGAEGDAVSFLGILPLPDPTEPNQGLADLVFQVHKALGYAILALLSLHVAGALRHHFVARDGVLRRMAP